MVPLYIIIGLVVLLILWLIGVYNGLITQKNRVDEAWSDITVQLKRRYDLIPNLVETVKAYAKHEKSAFEDVTKARAAAMGAKSPGSKGVAEGLLGGALHSLLAVAEAYPDLKANQNFKALQDELADTENKIQAARRFYNGIVRDFNTTLQVFPTNVFARSLGFVSRDFFKLDEAEDQAVQEPVKVDFSEKTEKTEQDDDSKANNSETEEKADKTDKPA